MIKKIINFIFSFIFAFIFLNVILAFIWPYITDYRIKSGSFYSDDVLNLIEILPGEQVEFYKETWLDRKFQYVKFVGHYEKTSEKQKYVNADIDNGRKIENNLNCEKNFFFFGSSNTFGYNVKDNQTIPAQFKKILSENFKNKNFCVYNFGSAYHFSTQETIFFITNLLKNKINKGDFIFFIDGLSEIGNQETKVDQKIKFLFNYTNLKFWEKFYFTVPLFLESLPIVQLYKRFLVKTKSKKNVNVVNQDEILNVFQKNVIIRKAICLDMEINCYTFLQPFPQVAGVNDKKLIADAPDRQDKFKKKYNLLKKTKYIVDISDALNNMKELSFVDVGHYTPKASYAVANSIYLKILKDLN